MSKESSYQIVKDYIVKDFKQRIILLPFDKQAAAKVDRDIVLAHLALLLPPMPAPTPQPTLTPTAAPIELDPRLNARIDKLNEQIREAGNVGKYADVSKLTAEKGKLLRSQGL